MSKFNLFTVVAVACAIGLAGCGGGKSQPAISLTLASTSLPLSDSGQWIDYQFPIENGCGGPYEINVIDGALPTGLSIETNVPAPGETPTASLQGYLLEDGNFDFMLEIIDTGCDPFRSTTQRYSWDVGVGGLAVVDADPAIIPNAEYPVASKWADIDAIDSTIYGQYAAYTLVVAGGQAPYTCSVIDDPADPDDGPLPFGVNMAGNSCSFNGSPSEILGSGRPFRLTFEVRDAAGNVYTRKLQWSILTPAINIPDGVLPDATVGVPYAGSIQLAGGVPSFAYELVDDIPTQANTDFTYVSGQPPSFTSATGFTVDLSGAASNRIGPGGGSTATYPAPTATGPFTVMPPEGLYLDDDADGSSASLVGVPRRAGSYTIYVHAYSRVVPNAHGQHGFKAYTLTVNPPAPLVIDPAITKEESFNASAPYTNMPDMEIGTPYNPDSSDATRLANYGHANKHLDSTPGAQLAATGGAGLDLYDPAPHKSQRVQTAPSGEGSFNWAINWDPDSLGTPQIPGATMDSTGSLAGTPTTRQRPQVVEFTVTDYTIPPQSASVKAQIGVGPDLVVITDSSASWTGIYNYYSYSTRFEPNDNNMTIKKFEAFSTGAVRNVLTDAELSPTHTVPALAGLASESNALGALLSGVTSGDGDNDLDLLRCTINPTGWWDDVHGLNPKSARPFQNADNNNGYVYYSQTGRSYSQMRNNQPSVSCVELPVVDGGVGDDPAMGIYFDGGRCYHFESDNRFGVFVVRNDGSIYVPFAAEKSTSAGMGGFGDGIFRGKIDGQQNSILRTVQMAVSPDGKTAAMKLKQTPTNRAELASSSRIVIFSLTGEKRFSGETYKIIDSGVSSTGSGRYLPAQSFALTNNHLYYLIGTQTVDYYQAWTGYYIMRYTLSGGASAGDLCTGSGFGWTQGAYSPMQTVFQQWYPNQYNESYTYYGYYPYHRYWRESGGNYMENGLAPMPFRVSANGTTCAILAGPNYTSTAGTSVRQTYAFADVNGAGAQQITSTRRRVTAGGGRGYSLAVGPAEYGEWGSYTGPTTGFEISDDGSKIAFTYLQYTGYYYASASRTSSSNYNHRNRQDVVVMRTTNNWASSSETEITRSRFTGSHRWRFGALAFTADNNSLLFWGGAGAYYGHYSSSFAYNYTGSNSLVGTMYICPNLASDTVISTMSTANGGSPDGIKTYSGTTRVSPSTSLSLSNKYGTLRPVGGFMSKNRNFLYLCDLTAVSSSDRTGCQLLGWNVSAASGNTINGHTAGRGFKLTGWPVTRGFMGNYFAYTGYALGYNYSYCPVGIQGLSQQVMARDSGNVFFSSGYQYYSVGGTTSTSSGQGPIYTTSGYGCYGYGGCGMWGFNAEVGGRVYALHHPSMANNSTSTQELFCYMQTNHAGTRVAWVSCGNYYRHHYSAERVNVASNINFDPATGNLSGFNASTHAKRVEAASGRAGESMAFTQNGDDIYYAYKSGASNETSQEIVKLSFNNEVAGTPNRTGTTGRMNILFCGR